MTTGKTKGVERQNQEGKALVLLWSNKHLAWWKPNGMGYCKDLLQAGAYRRSDAEKRTSAKGHYDGRCVEPNEVADELWKRRSEPAAAQMIFTLGLLQAQTSGHIRRTSEHKILPSAPAIRPVLSPENAQIVVDSLIAHNTLEARQLAEELVAMTKPATSRAAAFSAIQWLPGKLQAPWVLEMTRNRLSAIPDDELIDNPDYELTTDEFDHLESLLTLRAACLGWTGDPLKQPRAAVAAELRKVLLHRVVGTEQTEVAP